MRQLQLGVPVVNLEIPYLRLAVAHGCAAAQMLADEAALLPEFQVHDFSAHYALAESQLFALEVYSADQQVVPIDSAVVFPSSGFPFRNRIRPDVLHSVAHILELHPVYGEYLLLGAFRLLLRTQPEHALQVVLAFPLYHQIEKSVPDDGLLQVDPLALTHLHQSLQVKGKHYPVCGEQSVALCGRLPVANAYPSEYQLVERPERQLVEAQLRVETLEQALRHATHQPGLHARSLHSYSESADHRNYGNRQDICYSRKFLDGFSFFINFKNNNFIRIYA